MAIKSDGETLENSDEWALSEDSDGLDSDDEDMNDSGFESDENSDERVEENVNRCEIHTDSNLPYWEHIETKEENIAIEQGKN